MNQTKSISYQEYLIKSLKDPVEAEAYLNVALEEGDPQLLLLALRNVAEANGGMAKLAKKTSLNRENLYRLLSLKGNPEYSSLCTILNTLGFKLAATLKNKKAA